MKKLVLFTLMLCWCLIPNKAQTWNLVWSDEFNYTGLPDATKWGYEVGFIRNNELQYYTNGRLENAKVENGKLLIIGRKETYQTANYTSASVTTDGKFSWKYGKIEAMMKLPKGKGMWPAFWMLGQDIHTVNWPKSGEIDIMEHINSDNLIYGTMHWDNNGHASYGGNTTGDVTQYHLYSIEWTPDAIKWFLDGNKYWEGNIKDSINNTEEFHKPFYIILNLAMGGSWPGNPDGSTIFPDTVSVDYVRVYQDVSSTHHTGQLNTIRICPNPVRDMLTIDMPQMQKACYMSICNLNGQEILGQEITNRSTQITVNYLPRGVYILRFSNELIFETQKIIVQ